MCGACDDWRMASESAGRPHLWTLCEVVGMFTGAYFEVCDVRLCWLAQEWLV